MKTRNHLFINLVRYCIGAFLVLASLGAMAQQKISGRITDESNGQPLAGATVTEKGTRKGTVTDAQGQFSLSTTSTNPILLISSMGMLSQSIPVGAQTTLNVNLRADATQLSDVVVTANRSAVRKLETTTAIDIIGQKQLQAAKPEAFNEAVQSVPGVFANTSQGRRGGVIIRGFPDGSPTGGLVYTGVLLDGIPTIGTPGKLPENGFGFDTNIERVEVVRGSAATIYGRASAAGVVNMITRTGGDKLSGSIRLTNYDDILGKGQFNYRADLNLNGPITKNLRFNLGGWILKDNGYRNTGFDDKGGQFRANLDYLLPNGGSIRAYGMITDFNFQNLTDVPLDMTTLTLAPGWKNTDTYQSATLNGLNYRITGRNAAGVAGQNVPGPDGQPMIRNFGDAMAGGSYAKGSHVGLKFNLNLGRGFALENHIRYQQIKSGVKYHFALAALYSKAFHTRLLLDGDAKDTDIINDFRIKKSFTTGKTVHNFAVGAYLSTINLLPTTYSYLYGSNTDPNNIKPTNAFSPAAPPGATGSITRRGNYDESVTAFFIGDEMKVNERLSLNIGARYDMLTLDMKETKVPFDKELTRVEKFQDWSASIGANYLLAQNTAVYGNVNRAFRMPDYSAFTSLELLPNGKFLRAPNGINKNEVILNTEVGYRTTRNGIGIDIAGFYTNIQNRLASIFEDGILVSKPLGDNAIKGFELTLSYAPAQVRGLSLRTSFTFQDGRFTDFKIPVGTVTTGTGATAVTTLNVRPTGNLFGNTLVTTDSKNYSIDLQGKRLPGVPDKIWNMFVNYESKYFGLDFNSNINYGRFADATNILDLGTLSILNGGVYGKLAMKNSGTFRLGVQGRNLANAQAVQGIAGLADNDGLLSNKQRNETLANLYGQGYIQLPRRITYYLMYSF